MSSSLSVESLAEMFPSYSINIIRDIAEQCDNNHNLALEKLLELQSEEPADGGRPTAPPPALQTRQAMQCVLFPPDKGHGGASKSAPKPSGGHANGSLGPRLSDLLPHLASHVATPTAPPIPLTSTTHQEEVNYDEICPGMITLDTGQPPGGFVAATAPSPTTAPSRPAPATCRGWWPSWPLAPTMAGSQLPVSRRTTTLGGCAHTLKGSTAAQLAALSTLASESSHDEWAAGSEGTPNLSSSPAACHTPPRSAAGVAAAAPSTAPGPASPSPVTPLSQDGSQHPGAPGASHQPSSLSSDDDELAAMLPHLAHCFASSPAPSGTASPAPEPALAAEAAPRARSRRASEHASDGWGAAELVAAVVFYLQMFPNLKREVVGDVLQRYSDSREACLDQMIMLSSCVENAAGEGGSDGPDPAGWDSPSGSGSDEEEGGSTAGASWEVGLTPEELAGMEQGIFPGLQAPPLPQPIPLQQPGQQAALQQGGERPASPEGPDALPAEEKAELLQAEFKSIATAEVSAALTACDGSLFAAAELLRSFAAEDAASGAQQQGVATAAAGSGAGDSGASAGFLPQHAKPKVQHLARRFPAVHAEALEVALASCGYDLATARRTLREAGYGEVQPEPLLASTRPLAPPPPAVPPPVPPPPRSAPASPLLAPTAAPALPEAPRLALSPPAAPPGGLSLSEATYLRNQAIWEQERAQGKRLEQAYRRCFELAAEAHARGEYEDAAELSMRGRAYRQQFYDEQSKASRRISKRVNAANGLPRIEVDLHGQTVADALATVENGIRNLPESIPGGVVVRYITGKGRHSTSGVARIKPEVVRLLGECGVTFVEAPNGGGWVEATLVPAH
ncbi:hypothetical protein ABPG75_008267 [Micractinium tetrahymenae]